MILLKNRENGFTIVEIIAVLIIIGVLAATAFNRISSLSNYEVVKEAQILKNHLRYAQIRAMSHDEPWGISISGNTYTLLRNKNPATINLPNEDSASHSMPAGISILSDSSNIIFNYMGSPGNSTINITVSGSEMKKAFSITQRTRFIE